MLYHRITFPVAGTVHYTDDFGDCHAHLVSLEGVVDDTLAAAGIDVAVTGQHAGTLAAAVVAAAMVAAYVVAQSAESAEPSEPVIRITAKKFEFKPHEVTLKKGVPVILEFTTEDVFMGFNAPDLGVRTDIVPNKTTRVRVVPAKTGKVEFLCDVFCGSGHEEMSGLITVVD